MSREEFEAIGRRLRDTRLRHRLGVQEIAKHLHIRAQYLDALESGQPEALPGLPYARGYLQMYAQFLGLEAQPLTEAFGRAGVFPPRRLFHIPERLSRSREPSALLAYLSLAGAFSLMVVWAAIAPKPVRVKPLIPLPVTKAMLDAIPESCKTPAAPGYPPCYWQSHALYSVNINNQAMPIQPPLETPPLMPCDFYAACPEAHP